MDVNTSIHSIIDYFGGADKFTAPIISEIKYVLEPLTNEERARVYERMTEDESPRFKIGKKEVVAACRALGIGFKKGHSVPWHLFYCDCCGFEFRYAQVVSDDEQIDDDIHDVCPMCGFQPNWTITKHRYVEIGKLSESPAEWYEQQKKKCLQKYGRSNPFFNRALKIKERNDDLLKPIPDFKLARNA